MCVQSWKQLATWCSTFPQETLKYVDTFAKDLHNELVSRNLTDIVDVIFVSDHGMTDTSHPELVYIDDILGEEGMQFIEHEDGMKVPRRCNVELRSRTI